MDDFNFVWVFFVCVLVLMICMIVCPFVCDIFMRRGMRNGGTANPVPVVPPGGRLPVNPYPGVAPAPVATATTPGAQGMAGPAASPSQYSGMYQSNNPYGMGMGRPPYGGMMGRPPYGGMMGRPPYGGMMGRPPYGGMMGGPPYGQMGYYGGGPMMGPTVLL